MISFIQKKVVYLTGVLITILIISVFSCKKEEMPEVAKIATKGFSDVKDLSAKVKGDIIDLGPGVDDHGIFYSTTAKLQTGGIKVTKGAATKTGEFAVDLTGLKSGTKYYASAYCKVKEEIILGKEIEFTTLAIPTIATTAAVSITTTGATIGGSITSDGGALVTERGFYWRASTNPDTVGTKVQAGSGIGVFSASLTGLSPNVVYYFKAYAINSIGKKVGAWLTFTTGTALPEVTTNAITGPTSTSAISGGNVVSAGGGTISARGVCWGTATNPTISLTTKTNDGTGIGPFVSNITGLNPVTTYYIRAYATNAAGTNYGTNVTFTTPASLPVITATSPVTSITSTSAVSGGTISSDGGAAVTVRGVCWSTSANPTVDLATKTTNGAGTGAFSSNLTGLNPVTTYHVRAYATNSAGTAYGPDLEFITIPGLPVLTTTDVSSIASTSAASGGNISSDGGSAITSRGICWGTATNPTTALTTKTSDGTGSGNFTSTMSGLAPATTYHVRAYATNSIGTSYGADISFTTLPLLPVVTTTTVTVITGTTASGGGNVTSDGGGTISARGVCWSTSANPTIALTTKTNDGTGINTFTSSITGLVPATTYHVRAYATNAAGTTYGSDITFTTLQMEPTIATTAPTSITSNSATGGGNISSDGGSPVTGRGVCWSTSANPTIALTTKTSDGSGTGSFTSTITGLSGATTYHVRAYATNAIGTAYGTDLTFTTLAGLPSITTIPISSISSTSATSGGIIAADGGSAITARGVCWSTSASPTVSLTTKTNDGTGTGTFSSSITGLTLGVLYYVRAYATNSAGTSYGEEVSFTTSSLPTVTTTDISARTTTGATTGGNVIGSGGAPVTSRGVCYGTSANPTISGSKTTDGSGTGTFSSTLTGLTPNTTYYVRAYATSTSGTGYGTQKTFITLTDPAVTSADITGITALTATGGGNVTFDGNTTVTARGVCWSTTTDPTIANSKTSNGTGTGVFTSNLTGLTPNTLYYVRAYATNSVNTVYGLQKSFTTSITTPTVTTTAVSAISVNAATSGGNVTATGGSDVTARGICWSINPNPTTANSKTENGSGTGSFTANMTGLELNTTYYVRAYATNITGTSYGNQIFFTTRNGVATVTTATVISTLTGTTATGGGNITDDGGSPIIARGVCWSTNQNPTLDNNQTFNGTGTGSFTSSLTGLTIGIKYYVRAYATNSITTTYGNQVEFTASNCSSAPLSIAVDFCPEVTTGGNANWYSQTTSTHDGVDAARSGSIGHGGSTYMQATITGAGTLSFWDIVSSEACCDFLIFYVDDVQLHAIGGSTPWTLRTFTISGTGTHVIRWSYSKDGSVVAGSDCAWVDQVTFTPSK